MLHRNANVTNSVCPSTSPKNDAQRWHRKCVERACRELYMYPVCTLTPTSIALVFHWRVNHRRTTDELAWAIARDRPSGSHSSAVQALFLRRFRRGNRAYARRDCFPARIPHGTDTETSPKAGERGRGSGCVMLACCVYLISSWCNRFCVWASSVLACGGGGGALKGTATRVGDIYSLEAAVLHEVFAGIAWSILTHEVKPHHGRWETWESRSTANRLSTTAVD